MATTAPLLWLDGTLVPAASATLPVMAHAAQRGSLVFDAGAWHLTSRGPALFRVDEHVARFVQSARIVGLELGLGLDAAALRQAAIDVVNANDPKTDGMIRWSVFYAASEPDLVPRDGSVHVAVAAQLLQDPPRATPIRVATFADARKAAPDALPPTAKAAAAYLGPMLARRRAMAAGADDVVLLDVNGDIAEAPIANVCAVIRGALWTPPLGHILPGITRRSALEVAHDLGIVVREERLSREAFQNADEAFLTGTSLPLAPIGAIDGRALDAPGAVTARILETLIGARRGTAARYAEWLTLTRMA